MSKSKSRMFADLMGSDGNIKSDKMSTSAAKNDLSNVTSLPAAVRTQLKGDIGNTGATGAVGPAGSNGTIGVDGARGPAGSNGAVGAKGNTGNTGSQGATGPQGAQGIQGATGSQGNSVTGATGARGPTGSTGATGSTGNSGSNGSAGATGPAGPLITTYAAVGTYILGRSKNYSLQNGNATSSSVWSTHAGAYVSSGYWRNYTGHTGKYNSMSGTWRCMSTSSYNLVGLWIRIS